MSGSLRREKGLIFRILHLSNVPWIMKHGMHCANAATRDPNFVTIGNTDLIDKRHYRQVPCAPHGTLSDYVPFYFTSFTPMLLNIKTGFKVPKRPNQEIVIFVASLPALHNQEVPFLFTDRHAYLEAAQFSDDLAMLDWIDWEMLQKRDFRRDPEDPGKFERYQAEALIYKQMPIEALAGVMCYDDETRNKVEAAAAARGRKLQIITKPGWYF